MATNTNTAPPKLNVEETMVYKINFETFIDDNVSKSISKMFDDITKKQNIYNSLLEKSKLFSEDSVKIINELCSLETKRLAIEKEFADKELELRTESGSLKEGVSEKDIEKIHEARDTALEAIDKSIYEQTDAYKAWMADLANMSVEDLAGKMEETRELLDTLEDSEVVDPEAIAKAKSQLTQLEKAIEGSGKAWEKEKTMMTSLAKGFTDTGKAIGESIRNITGNAENESAAIVESMFSLLGETATFAMTMMDGLQTFSNGVSNITKSTADATSKAIGKAEKASGVLAIIMLVIQTIQKIIALFSNKEEFEFNKNLEKTNRTLDATRIKALYAAEAFKGIFGANDWGQAAGGIQAAQEALERYNATQDKIANRKYIAPGKENFFDFEIKSYGNVKDSVGNMQLTVRKGNLFQSKKTKSLKDAVPELFNEEGLDQEALKAFLGTETFKKLSEENKKALTEMSEDWEIYQASLNAVKDYLSGIFGSLGDTMTDALVSAFKSGTDSAKVFTDSVSEMIEQMAKDMMYSKFLEPLFTGAQDKMFEVMNDDALSEQDKAIKIAEIAAELGANLEGQKDAVNNFMEAVNKGVNGVDKDLNVFEKDDPTSDSRSANSPTGLAQASQDSIDELNGRFTTIQGYTYCLMENSKLLVFNSSESLKCLQGIRDNTQQLYDVRTGITSMRSTLDDMNTKGIKMQA